MKKKLISIWQQREKITNKTQFFIITMHKLGYTAEIYK